jgi:hypothetical protein
MSIFHLTDVMIEANAMKVWMVLSSHLQQKYNHINETETYNKNLFNGLKLLFQDPI